PGWVREAYNYMEAKKFGDDFTCAIEWWTVIERQHGWKTSTKGLGTEHRPPEVSHWLRVLRRNLHCSPPIASESAYSAAWWCWWSGLQPSWRMPNGGGRPVACGDGAWGDLRSPGKNGLLMVLLSLVWWRDTATDATMQDWSAAAADVRW
ncbi:hypothetical protein GY45DRAFT_1226980, partial [Cubamyces sp. BRFM 1775]